MVKFVNTMEGSISLDKCYDFFKNELLKAGINAFNSELGSVVDHADDYGNTYKSYMVHDRYETQELYDMLMD